MKREIKISLISASLLVSSVAFATNDHDGHHAGQGKQNTKSGQMQGGQMDMQKMMDTVKSELKLNSKQSKDFDAFAKQKKSLMEDMAKIMGGGKGGMGNMQNSKGGMGNMQSGKGGMGNMQSGKGGMGNMQSGKGGMGNMQSGKGGGMMSMMSDKSFEERMNFMQKHAEKMLATSKAGKKFYTGLSADQKKKLNEMPKKMQGKNGMGGMGDMNKMK